MVLMIVRREDGPDAWWPKDAQMRLRKQLLAAKELNRKQAE
jgi:hypothetical protein